MTLYFASSEDTGFTLQSLLGITQDGTYNPAFSRSAIGLTQAVATTDPPAAYARTPAFGPVTSFWTHALLSCSANVTPTCTLNAQCMRLLDATGAARIVVRGTGVAGQWKISTRSTAGVFADLVTTAAGVVTSLGGTTYVPLDLFCNYSTSGQVTLYLNGVTVADTGPGVDVTAGSGVTQLAWVDFEGFSTAAGTNYSCSQVIIQDTSTVGMALWTLAPAAAGNTQSWTPNTLANVNKAVINDATSVATASNNALTEWTTNITPPSGTWDVLAIVQEARISIGATGPQHFEWLLRTADGSDHVQGSVAPTTSFANYNFSNGSAWLTNPHTGGAWVIGDITTGFNIGIESLA